MSGGKNSLERIRVLVRLKEGVLDVQGKAIESSLLEHGVKALRDVRVGKVVEFTIDSSQFSSRESKDAEVRRLCDELFTNPVIESYSLEAV
ncbi:MAG: phosphoribosylformylglycinamidine synthase subunit PurS [Bdellovibrionales bacterium]|nr:phosphoribosylformylglycinamidine synthase subunit PurS [Bdellovibrionales bacterium]